MKVLHINTYDTGGAGKACLRIHKALLDVGFDSKVLLRNKALKDTPEVYEIWEELGTIKKAQKFLQQKKIERGQVEIISELGHVGELFSFPESIWDIVSHPLYEWADIIHMHWVAGFVDWSTFFPRNTKKTVWTLHDEEPFLGGFHYPPTGGFSPYLNLIEKHLAIKKKVLANQRIEVVSPSRHLAEKSRDSSLFSGYPHQVIMNCTNTDAFKYIDQQSAQKTLNLPIDKKIVLFVADEMNYPRKGLEVVLNAMGAMGAILLCTVGKGTIKESKNIVHLGQINDEERMNLIYASADLFVIPSLMDNLPNTIAESLCAGTPVIGFNVGGIPEMVQDEFGLLCNPNSTDLAKNILKGLSMNWDRKNISETNRNFYYEEKCAQAYISVYES